MTLRFAEPLAFDQTGRALHRGDVCFYAQTGDLTEEGVVETGCEVEILNLIPGNQACVIMPDGSVDVVQTIELQVRDRTQDEPTSFSEEQPTIANPDMGTGVIKLLTPNDLIINETADVLLKVMKKVSKAVRPLQYKVNKIARQTLASDGMVMAGTVECQVQVQDNISQRRGTIDLKFAIKDGRVEEPTKFEGGKGEYPITEAGFKDWLNIPDKPYFSKKPTPAIRSNRDTY